MPAKVRKFPAPKPDVAIDVLIAAETAKAEIALSILNTLRQLMPVLESHGLSRSASEFREKFKAYDQATANVMNLLVKR